MIKALAGDTILLGLSRMNIQKLKEGKPIKIDGAPLGVPGKSIVIMYGETEASMIHDMQEAGIILPWTPQ